MNGNVRQAIAGEVRAELARKKMTFTDLAEVLGVTKQAVSARVNGHQSFRVEELVAIAAALGVEPAQFLVPADARAA